MIGHDDDFEPGGGMPAVSRGALLALAVAVEGGLAVAAIGLGALTGDDPRNTLAGTVRDVALGLAVAAPLLGLFGLAYRSNWRPLAELRAQVRELVRTVFASSGTLDLVVVSLAAGIGEELFFRGWLQAWLARQAGPAGGLILASVLFGLAHPHSRVYVAMATGIGAILGGLWLATGSLVGPITAHAAYDLVALAWLTRSVRREGTSRAAPDPPDAD